MGEELIHALWNSEIIVVIKQAVEGNRLDELSEMCGYYDPIMSKPFEGPFHCQYYYYVSRFNHALSIGLLQQTAIEECGPYVRVMDFDDFIKLAEIHDEKIDVDLKEDAEFTHLI